MNMTCTLQGEDTAPLALKELLTEYYSELLHAAGETFLQKRWKELEISPSFLYYRVVIDDRDAKAANVCEMTRMSAFLQQQSFDQASNVR